MSREDVRALVRPEVQGKRERPRLSSRWQQVAPEIGLA